MKREYRSDIHGYVWELLAKARGWAMIRRQGGYLPTPSVVRIEVFKSWDKAPAPK